MTSVNSMQKKLVFTFWVEENSARITPTGTSCEGHAKTCRLVEWHLLLGPDDGAKTILILGPTSSTNSQISDLGTQLSSLCVSGDNGDVGGGLVANGNKVTGLVDVESTRVGTVGRGDVGPGEGSVGRDAVLGDGVVGAELLVVAVGRVDKVALDPDLTDLCARNGGGVTLVRRQGLLERQGHAASSLGVRDSPSRHAVGELVGNEEHGALSTANTGKGTGWRPESSMSWAGTKDRLCRGALGQLAGVLVDFVDPDQVRSEVRHKEEVSRGVDKHMVGMRSFLAGGVDAFSRVLYCLKRLTAVQRKLEGCYLGRLAVKRLALPTLF